MEDHHVDRPGVEAQQCVKLTGTNRSIGLSFTHVQGQDLLHRKILFAKSHSPGTPRWLGGHSEEPAPDPIPNSVVKILSADGTAS